MSQTNFLPRNALYGISIWSNLFIYVKWMWRDPIFECNGTMLDILQHVKSRQAFKGEILMEHFQQW